MDHFKLGYSNRSLGLRLLMKNREGRLDERSRASRSRRRADSRPRPSRPGPGEGHRQDPQRQGHRPSPARCGSRRGGRAPRRRPELEGDRPGPARAPADADQDLGAGAQPWAGFSGLSPSGRVVGAEGEGWAPGLATSAGGLDHSRWVNSPQRHDSLTPHSSRSSPKGTCRPIWSCSSVRLGISPPMLHRPM